MASAALLQGVPRVLPAQRAWLERRVFPPARMQRAQTEPHQPALASLALSPPLGAWTAAVSPEVRFPFPSEVRPAASDLACKFRPQPKI